MVLPAPLREAGNELKNMTLQPLPAESLFAPDGRYNPQTAPEIEEDTQQQRLLGPAQPREAYAQAQRSSAAASLARSRWWTVAVFCLVVSMLNADQNLMAPLLSLVAADFGFNDRQRDQYLGGYIAAAFFLVGAPAALLVGWLSDHVSRKQLLFWVVILGEAPCLLTFFVTRYWQLLLLRLLTGISVGGSFPLLFSLLGDLFEPSRRVGVAAGVQIATGAGTAVGQLISGFVGPALGWRWPFVIVALPAILAAALMLVVVEEPPRGAAEAALQNHFAGGEQRFAYSERITWEQLWLLLRGRSNLLVILQGLPGCLPWGVLITYFTDFLHINKGLSLQAATVVSTAFGAGGGVGVIMGGAVGQRLYNWRKGAMPIFMGATVGLAAVPMWALINADLLATPVAGSCAVGFASGVLASTAAPNIKAILLDVNEPESRGVALALQTVLDDVGKGLGPAIIALLITVLGRETAFNLAMGGWVPCGAMLTACCLVLAREEAAMQMRLRTKMPAPDDSRSHSEQIELA